MEARPKSRMMGPERVLLSLAERNKQTGEFYHNTHECKTEQTGDISLSGIGDDSVGDSNEARRQGDRVVGNWLDGKVDARVDDKVLLGRVSDGVVDHDLFAGLDGGSLDRRVRESGDGKSRVG